MEAVAEELLDFNKVPTFFSPEEEGAWWKKKALALKKGYEELKQDFEEYQEDSKTLEQELDTQLRLEEKRAKDLASSVNKLQSDNENLRSRVEQMSAEHNARTAEWSAEVTAFRKTGEELNVYVRQLEQKNDDLERANRAGAMSIEEFETRLNQAIERNVYLESELDEKDNLKAMVQRLKDETRDLRYELQVTKKGHASGESNGNGNLDSNRLVECVTPQLQPFSLAKAHQASLSSTPPSSSSSSRMSPLSIVNDLLRKVGALENKLTSYPNRNKEGVETGGNLRKSKLTDSNKNLQNKTGTGGSTTTTTPIRKPARKKEIIKTNSPKKLP